MLIVTALMAVTLFAPLAWFAGEAGEFGLYAFSLKTAAGEAVQPTVYMGVVLALACVLPFITIFLFKRRLLQLRLCVVEMVLLGARLYLRSYLGGRRFVRRFVERRRIPQKAVSGGAGHRVRP